MMLLFFFFRQQTLALKTAHSLFDKVIFIKDYLLLLISFFSLFITWHRHGPPPHPTPSADPSVMARIHKSAAAWSEPCIQQVFLLRTPFTAPAVRFDNSERLSLSPPAKSEWGDLSPPFIRNVMSMYSLLVSELEKMVDPSACETPWGFSWDQGTLPWQLKPKKTSFSLRCQSWHVWSVSPRGLEEIHILLGLRLGAIWVFWFSLLWPLCAYMKRWKTHRDHANEA